MIYLMGIVLIILLALVIVALGYRGSAKAAQRHAELQQQRADAVEAVNVNRQRLDTALETLHQTHREETLHDNDPAHLALRADFDNDWRALQGCTAARPAQIIQTALPLPTRPVLPAISAAELTCLADDVYWRLATRNRLLRQYAEDLETIIKSTRLQQGDRPVAPTSAH